MNTQLVTLALGLALVVLLASEHVTAGEGKKGPCMGKYLKDECGATDEQLKEMFTKMKDQHKQMIADAFGEECAANIPQRGPPASGEGEPDMETTLAPE